RTATSKSGSCAIDLGRAVEVVRGRGVHYTVGSLVSTRRIIVSSSNHSRLEAASEYLETLLGHSEVLALAPTRGAADDFVRGVSDRTGALYGVHRLTAIQL